MPEPRSKTLQVRNIFDIAKVAGVSAATVSRALAGKENVNEGTRERIQKLAQDYGFRVNQMASRLRTGQRGLLGVILPTGLDLIQPIANHFVIALLGHLSEALAERGLNLVLIRACPTDNPEWLDQAVTSGLYDGIFLIGPRHPYTIPDIKAKHTQGIVAWGEDTPHHGLCTVRTDEFIGGVLAARHLIARGCRSILVIGDLDRTDFHTRLAGARAEAAASSTGAIISHAAASSSFKRGNEGNSAPTENIPDQTDGVIAAGDMIAFNVLQVLGETGRKVPQDVAVVGFDDLPIADHMRPRLTTINQDARATAIAMSNSLLQCMAGQIAPSLEIPPLLTVRESS